MKKLFSMIVGIFLALVGFWACSSEDAPTIPEESCDAAVESTTSTAIRSAEVAKILASKARKQFYGDSKPLSRSAEDFDVVCINTPARYKSRSTATNDTLLYIVNFGNDEGYAIVPANTNREEIIAITEQGSLSSITDNEIPGLQMYLDNAVSTTAVTPIDTPITGTPWVDPFLKQTIITDTTLNIQVAPKVKVAWGQNGYEGELFSNGTSGCVTTAISQILSFFESPSSLRLTYTKVRNNIIELNWSELKKHNYNIYYHFTCPATTDTHTKISQMFREVGYRAEVKVANDTATVGTYDDAIAALIDLLPERGVGKRTDFTYLTSDIVKGVIFMVGFANEDDKTGHAWVVDGCNWMDVRTRRYTQGALDPAPVLKSTVVAELHYIHVNWGWNGYSNGYFKLNGFDYTNPKDPDIPGLVISPNKDKTTTLNAKVKYTSIQ